MYTAAVIVGLIVVGYIGYKLYQVFKAGSIEAPGPYANPPKPPQNPAP